jgi:hypothetical protein
MNNADRAWDLDRQIEKSEGEISQLIRDILDAIEVSCDVVQEEKEFFELTAKLFELRIRRACLPGVPAPIPLVKGTWRPAVTGSIAAAPPMP